MGGDAHRKIYSTTENIHHILQELIWHIDPKNILQQIENMLLALPIIRFIA
jgi:hypothetical protein